MNINIIFQEVRLGIRKTSNYILSHHEPNEYYKCYNLNIKNKNIYFCSRCVGIYIGIIVGLILNNINLINKENYYLIIILFPIFALIDWSIDAFTEYDNNKFLSSISGIFLGIAYILGVLLFIETFPNYFLILLGTIYSLLTLILIILKKRLDWVIQNLDK